MISFPAVVIHGLAQARLAVAPGRPVCLLSAMGAAKFAGCLWWKGIVDAVRTTDVQDILDCGDAPGRAMAALRIGQMRLVLDLACPAFAAVVAAGAMLGAEVGSERPAALDLGERGAARKLDAWLAGRDRPA